MKRILSVLLTLAMVLSVPVIGTTAVAAESTDSALVDQLDVIGSYADSTESIRQPDVGNVPSLEIYPSPEKISTREPSRFSFLMINLKGYSGQSREDGKDMPLDDNFFTSLQTTFDNARKNGAMLGIRFRYDDYGYENKEPDWDNLIQMFVDIDENGILRENADIITWCEIGTLGAFGEQWGSRYGDWGYSDELIDLYLSILPEEIDLLHRTPSKILHWLNSKLGTSYAAADMATLVDTVASKHAYVYNNTSDYVSGDGKDFSTGNLVKDDLARLGIYNDGYMGTSADYGTYVNRSAETAFMNDQVGVPYGGEYSGDRVLQIGSGSTPNTVWYPVNAIPEMYYTNLAYLHGGPWTEKAGATVSYSTLASANEFSTLYKRVCAVIGRSELANEVTVTADSDTGKYIVSYTALGYDTLTFTESIETAAEKKNGFEVDLSEYYGLDVQKFILDHEGYRFIVRSSLMTDTAAPGETFEYDIDIENTGFFKIDKKKELELIFVNGAQTVTATLSGVDVRDWDTGTNNLSGAISLPENITGGEWKVYLRITPENDDAKDDTAYAVKFANANIFDADLGANLVGAVTVDAPIVETEAYVETRPAGRYYYADPTAYAADTDYINFLDRQYVFTEDGHYGFTILFKLEGIADGSEINLTRWETNGSGSQLHSFNYFFKNNAAYGYGKTFTENGYYMIYCPFFSVGASRDASVAGTTSYSFFYVNSAGTAREDKDTPTSLNGNPAVITPLGFVEGAVTGYDITLHMGDATRNFTGTYNFKYTDTAKSEAVQFLLGTTIAELTAGYEQQDYVDENGVPYRFAGWTTQQGCKEGFVEPDEIAMGTLDLYPYYEPDFDENAARLNGLVLPVTDNVDVNGVYYTIDEAAGTAMVGTGSAWDGNAGFIGSDAILPAYITVDGEIYPVVGIASKAFSGCADLDNVYIPQQYAAIADDAFSGIEDGIVIHAGEVCNDNDMPYNDISDYALEAGIVFAGLAEDDECVAVFTDGDGRILQVSTVLALSEAVFGGTLPEKAGDASYCTYKFDHWSYSAAVTADTLFTPVYAGLSHSPGEKVYAGEGKCDENVGYTVSCIYCGEVMETGSEVIVTHNYGEYVSDGNATCTEDGTRTATCARCGDTVTEPDVGSATGHTFTDYVSDGNAVCGKDGTKTAVCADCDATDTVADEGSALTHDYIWSVTTEPDVGVPGVNTGVCEHCGDTVTEEIPALIPVKGDVNTDDELNIVDLTLIARYIAQGGVSGAYDLSTCDLDAMDMNEDGAIDQLDINELAFAVTAQ